MFNIITNIQKFIKPYNRIILIIFLVIIFSAVSLFFYNRYLKQKIVKNKFQDVANADNRAPTADIYFYHVDWCPHCVKAQPEWNKFVEANNNKLINGVILVAHSIDCTDNNDPSIKDILQKNNINSFPTVKLTIDGEGTIDFDSKIKQSSLESFVNTVIGK
jgi:thiol-disulfide isomerase/thioredoxin